MIERAAVQSSGAPGLGAKLASCGASGWKPWVRLNRDRQHPGSTPLRKRAHGLHVDHTARSLRRDRKGGELAPIHWRRQRAKSPSKTLSKKSKYPGCQNRVDSPLRANTGRFLPKPALHPSLAAPEGRSLTRIVFENAFEEFAGVCGRKAPDGPQRSNTGVSDAGGEGAI